LNSGQS